jgi:hypothetical protein
VLTCFIARFQFKEQQDLITELDLVGVQGIMWEKCGVEPAVNCKFFFENGNEFLRADQLKEDELGGACSTHGSYENAYKMLVRNLKGDQCVDGRTRGSFPGGEAAGA